MRCSISLRDQKVRLNLLEFKIICMLYAIFLSTFYIKNILMNKIVKSEQVTFNVKTGDRRYCCLFITSGNMTGTEFTHIKVRSSYVIYLAYKCKGNRFLFLLPGGSWERVYRSPLFPSSTSPRLAARCTATLESQETSSGLYERKKK